MTQLQKFKVWLLGWLLKDLCRTGLHWSGTVGSGSMGDGLKCDHCGADKYPEVFPGYLLHRRPFGASLPYHREQALGAQDARNCERKEMTIRKKTTFDRVACVLADRLGRIADDIKP